MFIGHPRGVDNFNLDAVKQNWRRADHRVMRAGETEDAMTAPGMTGSACRQVRRRLAVMETKLEGGRSVAGMRRERKSADGDQETLRRYGIGHDDAEQRSPEPLPHYADFDHAAARRIKPSTGLVRPKAPAEMRSVRIGWSTTGLRLSFKRPMLGGRSTHHPRRGTSMYRLIVIAAALLASSAAQAHIGVGDTHGFAHGFAHPMSGLDHILAMVAVGLFAAHLGGRALYLVPIAFVAMMIVGGMLGMMGVSLPFVEIGIALSVVVFGLAVALRLDIPAALAMVLVGFFAIFHGHAHGTEMPELVSGLAYGAGFILATATLHGLGIGLGLVVGRASSAYGERVLQAVGGATALIGIAILTGYV